MCCSAQWPRVKMEISHSSALNGFPLQTDQGFLRHRQLELYRVRGCFHGTSRLKQRPPSTPDFFFYLGGIIWSLDSFHGVSSRYTAVSIGGVQKRWQQCWGPWYLFHWGPSGTTRGVKLKLFGRNGKLKAESQSLIHVIKTVSSFLRQLR